LGLGVCVFVNTKLDRVAGWITLADFCPERSLENRPWSLTERPLASWPPGYRPPHCNFSLAVL